ncbi:hypothetical protein BDR22DRAFT_959573 [Usnea florida]
MGPSTSSTPPPPAPRQSRLSLAVRQRRQSPGEVSPQSGERPRSPTPDQRRRLHKPRPESKPKTSKTNFVEKFGAKFRKAFSNLRLSQAHSPKEDFVQKFHPTITTHPSLFPTDRGSPLRERGQGVIQEQFDVGVVHVGDDSHIQDTILAGTGPSEHSTSHVGNHDESTHENISVAQGLGLGVYLRDHAVTAAPETTDPPVDTAVEESQQEKVHEAHVTGQPSTPTLSHAVKARRSSCPPAFTSSPESDHSSETLFSTPRHSQTPNSPIYIDFHRVVDNHISLDSHCWLVLAQHLMAEEQDVERTTLTMMVEWMKLSHQAEVADLQSQVFTAETILAARDVDLANDKDDHDAAVKTITSLKDERSVLRKRLSECNTALRKANKEIKDLKKSGEDVLEQRSVVESTQDAPGPSLSRTGATGKGKGKASALNDKKEDNAARVHELEKQKEALTENLEYATEEVARLRSEAQTREREVTELRRQENFSRNETGHLHAMNAFYRHEMENENPARTARVDGHLKRKDERIFQLEVLAAEIADQLSKEKNDRAVERVYAQGKISGLEKDVGNQSNEIAKLTESCDALKEQKEEVFQMFRSRIMPSDVDAAFRHDYDVVLNDNKILAKIVQERQTSLSAAESPLTDLRAENLTLKQAAQATQLSLQEKQTTINSLEASHAQLADRLHIATEMHTEAQQSLTQHSAQQAAEITRLLSHGANDGLTRRFQAATHELAACHAEIRRLDSAASQWQVRALEVRGDWCPMLNQQEVRDWGSEEARWRLSWAERRMGVCERRAAVERKRFLVLRRRVRGWVGEGGRRGERRGRVRREVGG